MTVPAWLNDVLVANASRCLDNEEERQIVARAVLVALHVEVAPIIGGLVAATEVAS